MTLTAINLCSRDFAKVFSNTRKRTYIKLTCQHDGLSRAVLCCEDKPTQTLAEVTEIRVVRFGALGLSDAIEHGYNSTRELKAELSSNNQRAIKDNDVITIVRFELDGD